MNGEGQEAEIHIILVKYSELGQGAGIRDRMVGLPSFRPPELHHIDGLIPDGLAQSRIVDQLNRAPPCVHVLCVYLLHVYGGQESPGKLCCCDEFNARQSSRLAMSRYFKFIGRIAGGID